MATGTGLRRFYGAAAVLAAIAGMQLFVGAAETDRFFSWTIEPPLTAAFLGAAYWAALVLLAWAAMEVEWVRARTALPPVFAIAVLLLAATLIHLDKFDMDSIFGWFWLSVYLIVPPLLLALVWRHPRAAVRSRSVPLPPFVRVVLVGQAVVMLGFGIALFAAPTDVGTAWPWPLTPLTARAVGAFLCGFGLAAAFAVREGDAARLRGSALAYAVLGALELLALAIHWDDLDGVAVETVAYVALTASVLAVGLYGVRLSASSARRAASTSR